MKRIICLITLLLLFSTNFIAQEIANKEETSSLKLIEQKWIEKMAFKGTKVTVGVKGEYSSIPLLKKQYVYKATLINETGKNIKGFVWDYIFLDRESNSELKRHEFIYYSKVKIDEQKEVNGVSDFPPSNIINLKSLGNNIKSQYIEKVEVRCIIFEDKSTWKAKDANEKSCKKLFETLSKRK